LAEALTADQPPGTLAASWRIHSNPMDLTVVSELLARGEKPDLSRLLEQQYEVMAADYKRVNVSAEFPLKPFPECVYEMRFSDKFALPEEGFFPELQCLERHKMIVARHFRTPGAVVKKWYFRHDKIMEYFIAQTFLGQDNTRKLDHIRDPRFR